MHEMYDESSGWTFGPWRRTDAYDHSLEIVPDVGPEPDDEDEDFASWPPPRPGDAA